MTDRPVSWESVVAGIGTAVLSWLTRNWKRLMQHRARKTYRVVANGERRATEYRSIIRAITVAKHLAQANTDDVVYVTREPRGEIEWSTWRDL